MIKRVHFDEVDSTEEICTVFNRMIDELNKNEAYNAEVEKYNKSIGIIPKKRPKKKGGE